jgi:hypothetical protein
MKTGRIFWGVFFLTVGALFLLDRWLPIGIDWMEIWRFWPLILVLIGCSLLLRKSWMRVVLAAASAVLLACIVYALFSFVSPFEMRRSYEGRDFTQRSDIPFEPGTESASLTIDLGAARCMVRGDTPELIAVEGTSTIGAYELDRSGGNGSEELRLRLVPHRNGFRFWRARNLVDVRLNTKPVWSVILKCGASTADLDLSAHRVEEVHVSAGASRVRVRLGANVPETRFRIEAGVTSLRLEVPSRAGCEVRTDAPLSSKRFHGFTRTKSGLYRTDNFDSASARILITAETGISRLEITRYDHTVL